MKHPRNATYALCLLGLSLAPTLAQADGPFKRPSVDTSSLPRLAPGWAEINPLRGNAQAVEIGRDAFNQACAQCHGSDQCLIPSRSM